MKINSGKRYILGLRASAIIEIIIFIVVLLIIVIMSGNTNRFFDINPSPYWIIIILIAAQYGVNESVFCAIICSLVLLINNIPPQLIDQTTYNYYLYVIINPLMWFVTSVIIGLLRSKHISQHEELSNKFAISTKREHKITEGYNRLKSVKEMLEKRMASQLTSSSKGYSVLSNSQSLSKEWLFKKIPTVISETLSPKSFSIYRNHKQGFKKIYSFGWEENDNFQNVIGNETRLYQEILSDNYQYLSITNHQQQQIINNEGILICSLKHKATGNIWGMIKIERLDFMDLNISTITTFCALCDWIGSAYTNSIKYQKIKDNQYINQETKVYTKSYYVHQRNFLLGLSKKFNFPLYSVEISIDLLNEKYNINPVLSLLEAVKISTPPDVILYSSDQRNKYHLLIRSNHFEKVRNSLTNIERNFSEFTENKIPIQVICKEL
ncbi:MAG: hypothetical protein ACJA0H_001253 [Francisellaceae bacterium]|jgi:hypothetical protein